MRRIVSEKNMDKHDYYPWLKIKAKHRPSLATKLKKEMMQKLQIVSHFSNLFDSLLRY